MMIVTVGQAHAGSVDELRERIEVLGVRTRSLGGGGAVRRLLCTGEPAALQRLQTAVLPGDPQRIALGSGYPLCARAGTTTSTIRVPARVPILIGGGGITVAAGPCSVEGADMLDETAHAVRRAGAALLRGGAFKPRTSPYAFSGLGEAALRMLSEARAATGLPVVSEIMDARQLDMMVPHVDVLQVGARNMQNYTLLAELGRIRRPVLLKRGAAATVEELLLAAEHIVARGNPDVILCERGVRAHETLTRNTLDLCAVAVLKAESHLPVFVDPSHAAGRADLVAPLALAAIAAGADGLIIEVHPAPHTALSDGDQSLTPAAFAGLMQSLEPLAAALGRRLHHTTPVSTEIAA